MPMHKQTFQVMRILDANLNRLSEGLRVIEEIARLILNNQDITSRLKTMRHELVQVGMETNIKLLNSRDTLADVGAKLEVSGESNSKDLPSILIANSRRAQESLRVLEEYSKLPELNLNSDQYKEARFSIYNIEIEILAALLRKDKIGHLKGLYVIIDPASLGGVNHVELTRMALDGGASVIQLRDKRSDTRTVISLAHNMKKLCFSYGALFIVNDYLDVAIEVEADGVHLGQSDLPVNIARKQLPINMIIGCSASTLEEAIKGEKDGADYIGLGAVYPTVSKSDASISSVELVKKVAGIVKIPLVAIGGINKDNIKNIIASGAVSAAVISAVSRANNPEAAVRELIGLMKNEENNRKSG